MPDLNRIKKGFKSTAGVTLIEIVLAIGVLGIVMASAVRIFGISLDLKEAGEIENEAIQTVRVLSNRISAELKRATAIKAAGQGLLKFDMLADDGRTQNIIYTLTDNVLRRQEAGVSDIEIAANITEFNTGGIKLWSKLGSEYEISNPEIGPGGMILETPAFNTMVFDKGIEVIGNKSMQVMFPAASLLNHQQGTIEFWARPEYSVTDIGKVTEKHMIDSAVGTSGERIELFFHKNLARLVFRMNGSDLTRLEIIPGWQKSDLVHIAAVWDSGAKFLGQGRTMVLYVDGLRAAEVSPETTTWTPGRFSGYFCFGSYAGNEAEASFDNIKVYDYCKTNFNDRLQEEGEGLAWFTLTCSGGDSKYSITNSVRVF